MADWLRDEIRVGLQKLCCLGLAGQPDPQVLPGTLATWLEAITTGREFHLADRDRVQRAFSTLAMTSDRWPTPGKLLAAMGTTTEPVREARPVFHDYEREAREDYRPPITQVARAEQEKIQRLIGKVARNMTPPYMRESSRRSASSDTTRASDGTTSSSASPNPTDPMPPSTSGACGDDWR